MDPESLGPSLVGRNGQISTTQAAVEPDLFVVLPPNTPGMRRQHALISTPMARSAGADLSITAH